MSNSPKPIPRWPSRRLSTADQPYDSLQPNQTAIEQPFAESLPALPSSNTCSLDILDNVRDEGDNNLFTYPQNNNKAMVQRSGEINYASPAAHFRSTVSENKYPNHPKPINLDICSDDSSGASNKRRRRASENSSEAFINTFKNQNLIPIPFLVPLPPSANTNANPVVFQSAYGGKATRTKSSIPLVLPLKSPERRHDHLQHKQPDANVDIVDNIDKEIEDTYRTFEKQISKLQADRRKQVSLLHDAQINEIKNEYGNALIAKDKQIEESEKEYSKLLSKYNEKEKEIIQLQQRVAELTSERNSLKQKSELLFNNFSKVMNDFRSLHGDGDQQPQQRSPTVRRILRATPVALFQHQEGKRNSVSEQTSQKVTGSKGLS